MNKGEKIKTNLLKRQLQLTSDLMRIFRTVINTQEEISAIVDEMENIELQLSQFKDSNYEYKKILQDNKSRLDLVLMKMQEYFSTQLSADEKGDYNENN